ncbi:lectin BRA-3 isoform X1 [Tachysurus ichikawai]
MSVLSIVLLLLTGDAATGLFFRKHIYYETSMTWTEAQTYCRNNYVDLSIIDTQSEFESFVSQTSNVLYVNSWIGLRKADGVELFTQWCDGRALEFSMWALGQPDNLEKQSCVFIRQNMWKNKGCEEELYFFCYTWTPQLIVVQEMMAWEEALVYCRTHYTDLVSLSSETDYFLVNSRSMEILTPTFWTSLRFMDGSWFWVNYNYSYKLSTPLPSCPAKPFRCGAYNIDAGVWENRDCEEKMNFICYHEFW